MLDIAKRSNAVFLYTSSSEIYGNANVLPTPESYFGNVNPNGKRSCYDEGKRFSEALVMAYFREFGTKVIIQRPFNVYGPRIRGDGQYGRVVPRFILLALKNHPIEICGDGNQTRSFLYISDWIDATLKMLKSKRTSGQVFNVGSDEQVTIGKLAIMIKRLTNSRSKIVNVRPREDDVRYRAADITKVKEVISWKPTVSLEEGLLKTTQWYGKKLDLLHL